MARKKKRPMTLTEIEQNLKAMKSDTLKHFYAHDTMLSKKHADAQPEPFAYDPNKVRAMVIPPKRRKTRKKK